MSARMSYPAPKGAKPLRLGMNAAKRVARRADERDQKAVLAELGPGHARQHSHHQELVRKRHEYYGDVYGYDQRQREAERVRQAAQVAGDPSGGDPKAGDAGGARGNRASSA